LVAFARIPEEQRQSIVNQFLEFAADVLENQKGPEGSVRYFQNLQQIFSYMSEVSPASAQFSEHAGHVMAAISRSNEKSCDNYQLAESQQSQLASALLTIGGVPFESEDSENLFQS